MRILPCTIATLLFFTVKVYGQPQSANGSQYPAPATPVSTAFASPTPAASPEQPETQPVAATAPTRPSAALSPEMSQAVNRAIEREHALIEVLKARTPIVETYLQNLKFVPHEGPEPVEDHYFLGRMYLNDTVDRSDYLKHERSMQTRLLGGFESLYKIQYRPRGFSWMVFADRTDFDREHYNFRYAHREFLGDVRCLVFIVTPKKDTGKGRFVGRIWVEDQGYNIVRLNGTYAPRPRNAYFFHMDSWRLNLIPGYWVPAYIYSEEGDASHGPTSQLTFKAQTRLWGYDLQNTADDSELTQVLVDSTVKDTSPTAQDASPLQALWRWQQQAGDNVIERLQNAGLLAPPGDVDKVLETVINNLLTSNNVELPTPVHARVMLTTPLESFSAGNTIVLSRGLLDVLPDEASLAMALSRELAHIMLGHNLSTKYAFSDRMLFSDESTYKNLGFRHVPEEETEADQKALDLLKNSPYAQNLNTAGLFLREVAEKGTALQALLTPHLGTGLTNHKGGLDRMLALMNSAPTLDSTKLDQVAALPLGARIKLNPWDDRLELIKMSTIPLTSARQKMPMEVTPFFPRLTRSDTVVNTTSTANAAGAAPSN
jgi:hypothetical protein